MRGCLVMVGVAAALIVIGVACCTFVYGPTHVRFRLKIDVKDGDVIRTGSGVIEVGYESRPFFIPALGPSDFDLTGITGNAVTVDLGARGLLFAIFRYMDSAGDLPFAAYGVPLPYSGAQLRAALRHLERKGGWVKVPIGATPLLIHFRNINDPDSAQKVDPANLAASFGPGVTLESVMLELTDDPITPVPSLWPAWIKGLRTDENADGSDGCWVQKTPLCLQGSSFKGY